MGRQSGPSDPKKRAVPLKQTTGEITEGLEVKIYPQSSGPSLLQVKRGGGRGQEEGHKAS